MMTLVKGGMGGSETYATQLIDNLADHRELSILSSVPRAAAGFSPRAPEHVSQRVAGGSSGAARIATQLMAQVMDPALRRILRSADVIHYPFTVPAPRPPRGVPYVQTIHDVQHHDLPQLFTRSELAYRTYAYDRPARRAAAVITISEFSRQRILQNLDIDPDRVHVAHLGVDTNQFVPNRGPRQDFVLYPARGWPHKNHTGLIAAMEIARQEAPDLRLVLTGGDLDRLGDLPSWVERRGLVSRETLVELYQQAACLVFPSRYEGFGLPPLEAMASGCPVAAADAGALPEVCGDAATLFDPDSPVATAQSILAARAAGERRVDLGLAWCRRFTWSACADAHVEVYQRVADARARPRGAAAT